MVIIKKIFSSILLPVLCSCAAAVAGNEMTVIDAQGTSFVQHLQIDAIAHLN